MTRNGRPSCNDNLDYEKAEEKWTRLMSTQVIPRSPIFRDISTFQFCVFHFITKACLEGPLDFFERGVTVLTTVYSTSGLSG